MADTPLAFCAPPDIRYVRGRRYAPSGPLPYPRAWNRPDWMEEWQRTSRGRWAVVAALYVAPAHPTLPTRAVEVRQSVVATAADSTGAAVLREYRVTRAADVLLPPGGEEDPGFGTSPERADLVVPLGPGMWLVLEANLEDLTQREELLRVLRSARRRDR